MGTRERGGGERGRSLASKSLAAQEQAIASGGQRAASSSAHGGMLGSLGACWAPSGHAGLPRGMLGSLGACWAPAEHAGLGSLGVHMYKIWRLAKPSPERACTPLNHDTLEHEIDAVEASVAMLLAVDEHLALRKIDPRAIVHEEGPHVLAPLPTPLLLLRLLLCLLPSGLLRREAGMESTQGLNEWSRVHGHQPSLSLDHLVRDVQPRVLGILEQLAED